MSLFSRIQSYILPKEIDFFATLIEHSTIVEEVIETLYKIYITNQSNNDSLHQQFEKAEKLRQKNLMELNEVLITPIDKEAISRAYLNLDWVILSVKHLDIEMKAYQITYLHEYEAIFDLLNRQIKKTSLCFKLLKEKKFEEVLNESKEIILMDDELIREYSIKLSNLFDNQISIHVLKHKEILSQLKEISKRIHFCANTIEDFVFKMN